MVWLTCLVNKYNLQKDLYSGTSICACALRAWCCVRLWRPIQLNCTNCESESRYHLFEYCQHKRNAAIASLWLTTLQNLSWCSWPNEHLDRFTWDWFEIPIVCTPLISNLNLAATTHFRPLRQSRNKLSLPPIPCFMTVTEVGSRSVAIDNNTLHRPFPSLDICSYKYRQY